MVNWCKIEQVNCSDGVNDVRIGLPRAVNWFRSGVICWEGVENIGNGLPGVGAKLCRNERVICSDGIKLCKTWPAEGNTNKTALLHLFGLSWGVKWRFLGIFVHYALNLTSFYLFDWPTNGRLGVNLSFTHSYTNYYSLWQALQSKNMSELWAAFFKKCYRCSPTHTSFRVEEFDSRLSESKENSSHVSWRNLKAVPRNRFDRILKVQYI